MGTVLVVCVFAPNPTTAQGKSTLVPVIGTTVKYEGWARQGCGNQWVPYEQYAKLSGRVILPETKANVFYLLEGWGRDSGMNVVRFAPNGDLVQYSLGVEGRTLIRGPVGTYSEVTSPSDGKTCRYEIVADAITRTVPAGTYSNVSRLDVFCTTCGPTPVLQEVFYLSPEVLVPIRYVEWNDEYKCWSRVHELVSVTAN
jgi:hypothetical protein